MISEGRKKNTLKSTIFKTLQPVKLYFSLRCQRQGRDISKQNQDGAIMYQSTKHKTGLHQPAHPVQSIATTQSAV